MPEKIVAVGLLTRSDIALLGASFNRLWPLDDAACFEDLLKAIDQADAEGAAKPPQEGRD